MSTIVESLFTAILLILVVLLFQHMLEGSATSWLTSKFKVAPATGGS